MAEKKQEIRLERIGDMRLLLEQMESAHCFRMSDHEQVVCGSMATFPFAQMCDEEMEDPDVVVATLRWGKNKHEIDINALDMSKAVESLRKHGVMSFDYDEPVPGMPDSFEMRAYGLDGKEIPMALKPLLSLDRVVKMKEVLSKMTEATSFKVCFSVEDISREEQVYFRFLSMHDLELQNPNAMPLQLVWEKSDDGDEETYYDVMIYSSDFVDAVRELENDPTTLRFLFTQSNPDKQTPEDAFELTMFDKDGNRVNFV